MEELKNYKLISEDVANLLRQITNTMELDIGYPTVKELLEWLNMKYSIEIYISDDTKTSTVSLPHNKTYVNCRLFIKNRLYFDNDVCVNKAAGYTGVYDTLELIALNIIRHQKLEPL